MPRLHITNGGSPLFSVCAQVLGGLFSVGFGPINIKTSLGVSTVGAGGADKESVIGLLRKEGLGAAGMRGTTRDSRGEDQMGVGKKEEEVKRR